VEAGCAIVGAANKQLARVTKHNVQKTHQRRCALFVRSMNRSASNAPEKIE
jgi:hypothetical protein